MSADDELAIQLGSPLRDAADPDSGYVPPVCLFPAPHGHLTRTGLPPASEFEHVCWPHLDAAIATVAAPTPIIGQRQARCSGCDSDPQANPFDIVATYPSVPLQVAASPHVRACTVHAVRALTTLLEAAS